jgi:hypothetical protein
MVIMALHLLLIEKTASVSNYQPFIKPMKTKIQFKLTILALAALSASALSIPGGGQQPKFEGAGLYYGLVA